MALVMGTFEVSPNSVSVVGALLRLLLGQETLADGCDHEEQGARPCASPECLTLKTQAARREACASSAQPCDKCLRSLSFTGRRNPLGGKGVLRLSSTAFFAAFAACCAFFVGAAAGGVFFERKDADPRWLAFRLPPLTGSAVYMLARILSPEPGPGDLRPW